MKKFEEAPNQYIPKIMQNLNALNPLLSVLETYESEVADNEKQQTIIKRDYDKEKTSLEQKIKSSE